MYVYTFQLLEMITMPNTYLNECYHTTNMMPMIKIQGCCTMLSRSCHILTEQKCVLVKISIANIAEKIECIKHK